jgi:tartrate-resistant acid phosphatase type 5
VELAGGTTPLQAREPWGLRVLGLTDLQISKEDVVVRHIGKDASVLYEFKRQVNTMERS